MRARAMPPALLAAIAAGVIGSGASLAANLGGDSPLSIRAHELAWGAWFAESALTSAGLFELSRRLTGAGRRCAHAAGAILAVLTLWRLCRQALLALGVEPWGPLFAGTFRAEGALATAAAALIATSVGGWRRAPVASIASVLAVIGRGWVPWLGDALFELILGSPALAKLYGPLLELCGALALLRLIAVGVRDREATIADPAAAASGARIAATALWLRLAATVLLVLPLVRVRSPISMAPLAQGASLLALAMVALCAAGLLRLAGSRIEGLPALRLTAGAAAALWWVGLELFSLAYGRELRELRELPTLVMSVREAWPIAGPLIAVAGLALAGSSIAAWAAARGEARFVEVASTRTILFAGLSVTAAVLPRFWTAITIGDHAQLGFLIASARITGLAVMASLFSRAAEMLASWPTLPPARVLAPTDRRGGGPDSGPRSG